MKIINKYIIKEIIPPTIIALIIFTFVMTMNRLLMLANMIIQKGVGLYQILKILIYYLPSIIALTIPMAVLLGIIIGINRLSSDSEIIALRAGGISIYKLILPVMIFAIVLWMINSYIMIYTLPKGNSKLRELQFKIITSKTILQDVRPRVFNESLPNQVIYITDISEDGNWWEKIFIYQSKVINRPTIILAERGKPKYVKKSGRIKLILENGNIYETNLIKPRRNEPIKKFSEHNMILSEGEEIIDQSMSMQKDERSMTIKELWQNIQRKKGRNYLKATIINRTNYKKAVLIQLFYYHKKNRGNAVINFNSLIEPKRGRVIRIPYYLPSPAKNSIIKIKLWKYNIVNNKREMIYEKDWDLNELLDQNKSNDNQEFIAAVKIEDDTFRINRLSLGKLNQPAEYRSFKVELHKKFSIPFACIIFGILGLPLSMSFRRAGKSAGYVLGLIIFLLYYVFLMNGEVLADKGKISPFLGMWGANIIFGIIGILMLFKRGRAASLSFNLLYSFQRVFRRISTILKKQQKPKKKLATKLKTKPRVIIRFPRLKWKFPNILDRYIIITFMKIYILVFIAIYSVFALVDFVDINEEIERRHLSYSLMAEYFKFKFPQILSYIIPITILMSALIALSILSKFREIVAIKAAGISIFRVFLPLIAIAAVATIFSFLLEDNILPYSNQRLSQVTQIIKGGPVQTYHQRGGSRWIFGKSNRIFHFYAQDLDQEVVNRFSVFDFNPSYFTLTRRIFAQEVNLNSSKDRWTGFRDGWIQTFNIQKVPKLELFDFCKDINIEEKPSYFSQESRLPDEMSFGELREHIKELQRWGYRTLGFKVDLHWKVSFPFISLIFVLIGMPSSLKIGKKGTLTGIFISIALVVVYWNFMATFKSLGHAGFLPPWLAAWAPNIIFSIGGGYFILMTKT